jgi:hypothetical protein
MIESLSCECSKKAAVRCWSNAPSADVSFAAAPRQAQCAGRRIFVIGGYQRAYRLCDRAGRRLRGLFAVYAGRRDVQRKFTIIFLNCEKRYFPP